jgi:ureidoacrylate peracid hydrolase
MNEKTTAATVRHPCDLIPQGLVDKVVARRRGSLHMHPTLDGSRTALVVVDLDEHSVDRADGIDDVRRRVNLVARAVRAAGGTVAYVTSRIDGPGALADSLGAELAATYHAAYVAGAATRLAPDLDVAPDDLHVEKARASAFFPGNCDLHEQMQAREIEAVLVVGLTTSVCCESSARDACELGYRVTMVSDALWGQSFGVHEASLSVFFRNFGDVRPTDEVLELLALSGGDVSRAASG